MENQNGICLKGQNVLKKILIIDQKPFSRTLLKNDLAVGYQVFEAQDYVETKALLQQEQVDLILLDMDRAENDGAEICTNLKDDTFTENTPLILLSSYNQKEDIISGLYSGADDYLTKPIYPNELFARIDTHLRVKNYYSDLEKEDLMMLLELTEFISVSRKR